jgi:hypothetical protein
VGGKSTGFDADEWTCIHWMYLVTGRRGAAEGRLFESRGKVRGEQVAEVDAFITRARARFDDTLVLYEQGHGLGTITHDLPEAVELVERLGLRYRRRVAGLEDEVLHKGRPVAMEPDQIGRVSPMVTAFEKLDLVCQQARDRGLGLEVSFRLAGDSF